MCIYTLHYIYVISTVYNHRVIAYGTARLLSFQLLSCCTADNFMSHKKLSYRRVCTMPRRRSLRHSRLFKVTDFGTNRKPACDFLLVNNINHHDTYRIVSQISRSIDHIIAFNRGGVPLYNEFILRNRYKYRHSHILLKLESGLHLQHSSIFTHFYVIGPKAAEFASITQHNGHCAVQGHSRSPNLVPIESSMRLSTSDYNTNLHSISHRFQVIADYCSDLRFTVFNTLVTSIN